MNRRHRLAIGRPYREPVPAIGRVDPTDPFPALPEYPDEGIRTVLRLEKQPVSVGGPLHSRDLARNMEKRLRVITAVQRCDPYLVIFPERNAFRVGMDLGKIARTDPRDLARGQVHGV